MKSGISFRKKNRLKTGKNFSRHSPRRKFLAVLVLSAAAVLLCVFIYRPLRRMLNPDSAAGEQQKLPPQLLLSYMNLISEKEYETMYDMLDLEASGYPDKEDFIKRNSSIYEGIAMQDMEIEIIGYDKEQETVSYRTSFDTAAGAVSFENEALFFKQEDGYGLVWQDSLIFPELRASDKVRCRQSGEILQTETGCCLRDGGRRLLPGLSRENCRTGNRLWQKLQNCWKWSRKPLCASWKRSG